MRTFLFITNKETIVNREEMREVMLHILYSMVCVKQGGKRCADHGQAFLKWCEGNSSIIEDILTPDTVKNYGDALYAEARVAITQKLANDFLEKVSDNIQIAA